MNILLVYPKHPDTFWSFKYALKFVSKKASLPPLSLLTVASLLPRGWDKRVVDLNVAPLPDRELAWADYVFISAISVQRDSALQVIQRCRQAGKKIVAGGPLFTTSHADFDTVDHFVLGEAEVTLPLFLDDLAHGRPRPLYASDQRADITQTPAPDWSLVRLRHYASMSVQYSRGCPFHCDFCDITTLYGRQSRTKTAEQTLAELDRLYRHGWRGSVFFVDDNFIGNTRKLKTEVLPAIAGWMERHRYPFSFFTQTSVNLADDETLMDLMVKAGFDQVFMGIESPHEQSLAECSKTQNHNRDLLAAVKKCQRAGLQVQAGFIVGFDSDPAGIFDSHIDFIQQSGIATAMVGVLNALKGTRLYQRFQEQNRLLQASTGNNTDASLNFIPRMNRDALLAGYRKIVATIYTPRQYYARVRDFLKRYRLPRHPVVHVGWRQAQAFLKSVVRLGIIGQERFQYWKLLAWSLLRRPQAFALAVTLAIYGYHFRKVTEQSLRAAEARS